jgi:hypothetical protein
MIAAALLTLTWPALAQEAPVTVQCGLIQIEDPLPAPPPQDDVFRNRDGSTSRPVPPVDPDVFSASRVIDLEIRLLLPKDVYRDTDIEVRFVNPNGHLYEAQTVAVGRPDVAKTERRVEGYPHPLEVKEPRPFLVNREQFDRVDLRWPVGGTLISKNGLYGTWTVVALTPGTEFPCATKQFVIER